MSSSIPFRHDIPTVPLINIHLVPTQHTSSQDSRPSIVTARFSDGASLSTFADNCESDACHTLPPLDTPVSPHLEEFSTTSTSTPSTGSPWKVRASSSLRETDLSPWSPWGNSQLPFHPFDTSPDSNYSDFSETSLSPFSPSESLSSFSPSLTSFSPSLGNLFDDFNIHESNFAQQSFGDSTTQYSPSLPAAAAVNYATQPIRSALFEETFNYESGSDHVISNAFNAQIDDFYNGALQLQLPDTESYGDGYLQRLASTVTQDNQSPNLNNAYGYTYLTSPIPNTPALTLFPDTPASTPLPATPASFSPANIASASLCIASASVCSLPPSPLHLSSPFRGRVGTEKMVAASKNRRIQKHNAKLYHCKLCHDVDFTTKSNLLYHERGHRDEKPFPCPEGCGKAFRNRWDCNRHAQNIHQRSPPKRAVKVKTES